MIKEVIFSIYFTLVEDSCEKDLLSLGTALLNKIQVNQGEFRQHKNNIEDITHEKMLTVADYKRTK